MGRAACWVIFLLSLAYVPAMLAGFLANGGFDKPVADPYLAVMELLILLMAIPLVVLFACVHTYAPAERKTLTLSAFALVTVAVGITVCVHVVLLTAGRQLDAATSPGYDLLLSWNWPSVAFALDIASWDFFLGFGLLLAAAPSPAPACLASCVAGSSSAAPCACSGWWGRRPATWACGTSASRATPSSCRWCCW